jgi:hypothetical protein
VGHLPGQAVLGLIADFALAMHQRKIHGHAIDAPLRHPQHDSEAEDVRMVLAEEGFCATGRLMPRLPCTMFGLSG